ncbi:MAG: DUF3137 domain-containing protein [Pseudomonadota bacterium]
MGFIDWLIQPIRDTQSLAPSEAEFRNRRTALGRDAPKDIEAGVFETLEKQRRAALAHRRRMLLVGVPALPILGVSTTFVLKAFDTDSGDAIVWGICVAFFSALLLRAIAYAGIWIFRKTAKLNVLSALAARQGLRYDMGRVDKETLRPFKEEELFGSGTSSGDSEDVFSGKLEGVDFVLFEARRTSRSASSSQQSSSETLVFHGLCLQLRFPKRFSGITRVLSDYGLFNRMHLVGADASLERVRLEDPRFEKQFEVVSTDQVEARYLLTPALMERLVAAQRILGKRTVLRAGFHGHHLLLTLDTRKNRSLWSRMRGNLNQLHHFEVQDVSKPVEQMEMVQRFEQEIALCKDIITTLQLNMRTRI